VRPAACIAFRDIEDDKEGFVGEKLVVHQQLLFFGRHLLRAQRCIGLEPRFQPLKECRLTLGVAALACLDRPHAGVDALQPLLDEGRIGEGEFELHRADVPLRVYGTRGMGHRLVFERPCDVDQSIAARELREKLARGSLPGAEGVAGEVDVSNIRQGELLGVEHRRQPAQAFVRHLHDADIGLHARAVRAGCGIALRDRIEGRRFARALITDDAKVHRPRLSAQGVWR
jgi:hypothetical protein